MADPALEQKVREEYPAFAWLLGIPEVGGLLEQAASEGWDATRLQAQLYATYWWQHHSETQRQMTTLWATDPAQADQLFKQRHNEIAAEIRRLGANLTYDEELWITSMSLDHGATALQITQTILQISRQHGVYNFGQVRKTTEDILALTKSYGVPISGGTILDWAYRVNSDTMTLEGIKADMTERAKEKYANNVGIKAGLERGLTVWDIMQPVMGRVSEELGVNPDTLDLTTGMGAQLVNYQDPNTGELRVMNDTEATRFARSQSQWRDTNNGRSLASQLVDGITQRMGRR